MSAYSVGIGPWLLLALFVVICAWPLIRKLWDRPLPRERAGLQAEYLRLMDRLTAIADRGGDYMTAREMRRWDRVADRLGRVRERLQIPDARPGFRLDGPPPWHRGR